MRASKLTTCVAITTIFITAGIREVLAQRGVFQRTDAGQQQVVVSGFSHAANIDSPLIRDDDSDEDEQLDPVAATTGIATIASVDGAVSSMTIAATARNLTPTNATTYAPTVDTDLSLLQLADASATLPDENVAANGVLGNANSLGTFILDFGAEPQGVLHGTIYLVAVGSSLELEGADNIGESTTILEMGVGAGITLQGVGAFGVQANYNHDTMLWNITGNLPGQDPINDVVSGVNHFFNFAVTVPSGIEIGFASNSTASGTSGAHAFPFSDSTFAQAQINYGLSASAWGFATPIGQGLDDGDFNADGSVDDEDLFLWLPNNGTDIGATLIEGDGDQDGDVDLDDLILWLTNTSSPGIPGDFDGDNDVDGRDFLLWQRGFGTIGGATTLDGDANRDGNVDSFDLEIWQSTYGIAVNIPLLSVLHSVPEPSSLTHLLVISSLLFSLRTAKGAFR